MGLGEYLNSLEVKLFGFVFGWMEVEEEEVKGDFKFFSLGD